MRTLARSPAAVNGDLPALKPDVIVAVRGRFLEGCRYVAPLEPSSLERLYREIDAQNPKVWSADFDRLICPWWPVCDPVVGGRVSTPTTSPPRTRPPSPPTSPNI